MHSPFDLTGKNAIVTGSSRGIGKAIARMLAEHGANVVISSRKAAACDETAAEINALGRGRAVAIPASIADKAQLEELVDATRREFGPINVVVCNAASNPYYGPSSGIADEVFEKVLRNNVLSTHWLAQMTAPEMIERKSGSIIIVSSIGAFRGSATIGPYNISKAADIQLARNLAVEFGGGGVRVNCIAPGLIKTDFSRALWENEQILAGSLRGTALGRMGNSDDVAGTALFLASDASRYITGQAIVVDGGMSITISAFE